MLKFKMLLFAVVGAFAVLSTAVAAGEELREAGAVIKENGWTNFEEVLALAEAGKLKTGEFRYDWPILMAKFRTGKITARELWTQCHALAHNPPTSDELWPLWFTLPRHIVQYGNDPEFPFPTRPDHSPCRARLRSSPGGTDARRGKQQFVKRDIRVRRRLLCPALSSVLAGLAREHFSAWNRTSVGKIDSPGTAENRPPAKGERFSHRYCCTEQRSLTAPRRLPSGRSV